MFRFNYGNTIDDRSQSSNGWKSEENYTLLRRAENLIELSVAVCHAWIGV